MAHLRRHDLAHQHGRTALGDRSREVPAGQREREADRGADRKDRHAPASLGQGNSFEGSDKAYVKVKTSPGGIYSIVLTLLPAQSDNLYHLYDVNLGVCDGVSSCEIYFDADMSGDNDYWFTDDVEVRAF